MLRAPKTHGVPQQNFGQLGYGPAGGAFITNGRSQQAPQFQGGGNNITIQQRGLFNRNR